VDLSRNAFSSAANARSHRQVPTPSARLRDPDVLPTYHLFPQTYLDPQLDNLLLSVTVTATPLPMSAPDMKRVYGPIVVRFLGGVLLHPPRHAYATKLFFGVPIHNKPALERLVAD
jgi:hypothetical protein